MNRVPTSRFEKTILLRTHPGSLAVKPGTLLVALVDIRQARRHACARLRNFASAFRPNVFPLHDVRYRRRRTDDREQMILRFRLEPPSRSLQALTQSATRFSSASRLRTDICIGSSRTATRTFLSSVVCRPSSEPGGARRDRTDDLMLAKHALSQLSYGPVGDAICRPSSVIRRPTLVGLGGLEPPTSRLSSARSNQLSYKPGSED